MSDKALQSGKIDIKPEYLSSELLFLDPEATASGDPDQVVEALMPLLDANDVTLLDYASANDQNSFVVTGETAETYGLTTMSDLAAPASVDDRTAAGARFRRRWPSSVTAGRGRASSFTGRVRPRPRCRRGPSPGRSNRSRTRRTPVRRHEDVVDPQQERCPDAVGVGGVPPPGGRHRVAQIRRQVAGTPVGGRSC